MKTSVMAKRWLF